MFLFELKILNQKGLEKAPFYILKNKTTRLIRIQEHAFYEVESF
jgi:hypothetical protein